MKLKPNLGPTFRVVYVLIGGALVAVPFLVTETTWLRLVLPILGFGFIAAGATGL